MSLFYSPIEGERIRRWGSPLVERLNGFARRLDLDAAGLGNERRRGDVCVSSIGTHTCVRWGMAGGAGGDEPDPPWFQQCPRASCLRRRSGDRTQARASVAFLDVISTLIEHYLVSV